MTLRYAMKQLLRSPARMILFIFLMVLSVAVFSLGFSLFAKNTKTLSEVDETFVTRGTLTQLPDDVEIETYQYTDSSGTGEATYEVPVYESYYTPADFAELPYKKSLEYRPSVYSHLYKESGELLELSGTRKSGAGYNSVIIFEPLEDFYSKENGEILITDCPFGRVFSNVTTPTVEGYLFKLNPYFYEESLVTDDEPAGETSVDRGVLLEKGKTYISVANLNYEVFEQLWRTSPQSPVEDYREMIADGPVEYTEGFNETEVGKAFASLINNAEISTTPSFIVTPTNGLEMIAPFFDKEIQIVHGEEISEAEFEAGERVCMISNLTANQHNLQVGDFITIDMYAVAYAVSTISTPYEMTPIINATDEPLSIFQKEKYKIVGVYERLDSLEENERLSMGTEVVFVPMSSIESLEKNVVTAAPMNAALTSFTIENEMINEFKAQVKALDVPTAEFTYYDMGYSVVSKGLKNVRSVSFALFVAGGISILFVLILFLYLQVSKKSQESAVQISLGTGKLKTGLSLLVGVMLIVTIGAAAGVGIGYGVSGVISELSYTDALENSYSTSYSEDRVFGNENTEANDGTGYTFDSSGELIYAVCAGALVVLAALLLALIFIHISLKKEPMKLLSKSGGAI